STIREIVSLYASNEEIQGRIFGVIVLKIAKPRLSDKYPVGYHPFDKILVAGNIHVAGTFECPLQETKRFDRWRNLSLFEMFSNGIVPDQQVRRGVAFGFASVAPRLGF